MAAKAALMQMKSFSTPTRNLTPQGESQSVPTGQSVIPEETAEELKSKQQNQTNVPNSITSRGPSSDAEIAIVEEITTEKEVRFEN